ncbi:MAG TPA: tRNA (guanosine(37)-N1)-methyltransferase TrmD, partial [Bacillota bacterium]|nr:tRNA (guanosine(37)-N1)-methyltransferase TrmD [Bacillota bacterium]
NQEVAKALAAKNHLILICGHYEGIDQRVIDQLATMELSIGDYVLTGGELPALVVVDAVSRLLPGVLGNRQSVAEESFEGGLLEYPQYTRPAVFRGLEVPPVLLSGNHQEVARWRREMAVQKTKSNRPELLDKTRRRERI